LSGTVTKSPVFGAALFCWAVPVLKPTVVMALPVVAGSFPVLLALPVLQAVKPARPATAMAVINACFRIMTISWLL